MPSPRHIIWITCDHLRFDDLGGNGSSFAYTPHIDRLIAGGITFRECFAQSPVCMPSRCSFMTGCYPHQTGVVSNGQELDPAHPLAVARCFSRAGYRTAQIGKLHFQAHEDCDLERRRRHTYGFEHFLCDEEPGCYDGPYLRWLASERPELVDRFRIARPTAPGRINEAKHPTIIEAPWQYSFSGWIAEQADRYLAAWGGTRGRQERHFLHLGFYAPHPPLNPTADMLAPLCDRPVPAALPRRDGEADDKPEPLASMLRQPGLSPAEIELYRRHFAGMVVGIDRAVGRVLETLRELQVLDDTLIVFGSDHGDFCGDHGLVSKGPAWYDSVARVPLVLHWPAGLRSGSVGGLVEMVDVLPSLLGLCGAAVPPTMAGRDLSAGLRDGDFDSLGRADVLACFGGGHLLLREQKFKYIRYHRGGAAAGEVLYDLSSDPDEYVNLAAEAAYVGELQRLRERALQRLIQAAEPITPRHYRF